MKLFKLSVAGVIWRFYLMMALIVIAGFTGLWFLAILALPLFFSALMGVSFDLKTSVKDEAKTKVETKSKTGHPDVRSKERQVTATIS